MVFLGNWFPEELVCPATKGTAASAGAGRCAPTPLIYMVASAYGRPLRRAGRNRACILVLLMGSADARPSAAVELSPLLKERPAAAEAKVWCEENLPKLPADQRAIILGLTPRGALNYDASPVPAALLRCCPVTTRPPLL